MQVQSSNLADLLADISRAEYMATAHFKSHQKRGEAPRDCVACLEHDQEMDRADAALTAFYAQQEAA